MGLALRKGSQTKGQTQEGLQRTQRSKERQPQAALCQQHDISHQAAAAAVAAEISLLRGGITEVIREGSKG